MKQLPKNQQKELDTVIAGTKEECLCANGKEACLNCANGYHGNHCQKPDQPRESNDDRVWKQWQRLLRKHSTHPVGCVCEKKDIEEFIRSLSSQQERLIEKIKGLRLPETYIQGGKAYNKAISDILKLLTAEKEKV